MSAVCPICRFPRKSNDQICSQCGAPLPDDEPPNHQLNLSEEWLSRDEFRSNANVPQGSGYLNSRKNVPGQSIANTNYLHQATLVGKITRIVPQQDEPPDTDIWTVLFWILLAADLIYLIYQTLIVGLVVVIVILVIGLLLSRGRNLMTNGCLSFLFILPAIFQRQQNNSRIPVTTYIVRPEIPNSLRAFRVKGQLNLPPTEGDRVRVWGPIDQDIVRFRGGENISDEINPIQLSLRNRGYGLVWFIGLAVVNVVYFLSLVTR